MLLRGSLDTLTWESEFFNLYSARLSNIDSNSPRIFPEQLAAYQRVQAKISATNYQGIILLQQSGFIFVEGELDLFLPISIPALPLDEVNYTVAQSSDIPVIRDIAACSFQFSRFRSPWYSAEDNSRFYALWAEKGVMGQFDHCCLLVKDTKQQIQGFVTLKIVDDNDVRIGLLAVNAMMRNQQIGSRLLQSSIQWCQQHKKNGLWIATQSSNIPALRLYQKAGAIIEKSYYWFYR